MMDKRWIAILIIMVIAGGCIYFISQTSPTVGSAIADVNNTCVTLPYGFSTGPSDDRSLEMNNKNTGEQVIITDLGKGDVAKEFFDNNLNDLSKSKNKILDTENVTENGVTVYIAHYIDSKDNKSIAYYYTYGHTYSLQLNGFDDFDRMDEIITFIAGTTHPDYKKAQDPDDSQEQSDLAVKYEKKLKSQE
jgi:hypothetical protein